jgi:hypothetical protein
VDEPTRANALLREEQRDEVIASVQRALPLERGVLGGLSGNGTAPTTGA